MIKWDKAASHHNSHSQYNLVRNPTITSYSSTRSFYHSPQVSWTTQQQQTTTELRHGRAHHSTVDLGQMRKLKYHPHLCRRAHTIMSRQTRGLPLPSQKSSLSILVRRRLHQRMATPGSITNHKKELQQHKPALPPAKDTKVREERGDRHRSISSLLRSRGLSEMDGRIPFFDSTSTYEAYNTRHAVQSANMLDRQIYPNSVQLSSATSAVPTVNSSSCKNI
jgi:hypothetical protein